MLLLHSRSFVADALHLVPRQEVQYGCYSRPVAHEPQLSRATYKIFSILSHHLRMSFQDHVDIFWANFMYQQHIFLRLPFLCDR